MENKPLEVDVSGPFGVAGIWVAATSEISDVVLTVTMWIASVYAVVSRVDSVPVGCLLLPHHQN